MDHHRASTSGSEQMPAPAPMFRPQKPKELNEHIYQLYKPENGEPTMEILFFHGLQFGHSLDAYLSTWTAGDASKEVWPGTWLAEIFPQAHVFSIAYDASVKTTTEHGRLDLHNLAENLVQDISSVGIGQGFGRPVIFVGHCFGGLAIKELFVQADERNHGIGNFLNNVGGVFFYGTPHHGSHLFDKAPYFLNGPLLDYVKSLSTQSARLEKRFVSMCTKYNIKCIASVGESRETSWGGFRGLVVPEASARYGDFYMDAADHISLCKPAKKTSSSFQHLIRFIQSITPKVQGRACFQKIQPQVPKEAVGLDLGVEDVCIKLQTKRSVGIVGMGGVGKTTLARELLNKLGPTFEFTCFVSVVKEIEGTVEKVKAEIWKQMQCGGKNVASARDWSHLTGKKLLLVLDDVASDRDLVVWADIVVDVAPTSRLVATSRDKELLKNMDDSYHVPFLNEKDSKQLFVSYAFPSQLTPPLSLQHDVDSIVKKCDGLPLALEVLGKYLKGKERDELWKQTLQALGNADNVADLDERLWAKLKVSYIGLKEEEQQMFLDVTTFFSLGDWTLLEAKAAWSVNYGLEDLRWHTLVDRSLVYDGQEDEPIKVHEQLQSLGRKLASDDKYIRSWDRIQGWNLLQSTSITDDKEIRSLRLSQLSMLSDDYVPDYVPDIDHPQVLKGSLSRLTKVQYLDIDMNNSRSESGRLARLLKKIRGKRGILSFRDVLKKMLPTELVLLRTHTLQFGPILCDPILLRRLAVLKLILPNDVKHLSSSFGQLSMLKILSIVSINLRELPNEIGNLHHLERLAIEALSLITLPQTFGRLSNLKHLTLDWCALSTLPESFGQLCQLEYLKLNACWALQSLPESVGQLSHLKHLILTACEAMDTLPSSFGQWPNLEKLSIYYCPRIKTLPFSPGHLSALRHLDINGTSLVCIPDWVQTLPKLEAVEFGETLHHGYEFEETGETLHHGYESEETGETLHHGYESEETTE